MPVTKSRAIYAGEKVNLNSNVKFTISNGSSKIILPVVPDSFEITDHWDNQELNINQIGVITMIGKRGLRSITIDSFLPLKKYEFVTPGSTMSGKRMQELVRTGSYGKLALREYATYHPWNTIKKLQSWRGKVLTFSISGTEGRVSWPCVIDGDFTYGEKDASGDVYYTLTLKEYKRTKAQRTIVPPARKAKASKPVQKTNVLFYETKKKDTLKIVSKKMTGTSSYASDIYKQNKATCKKAFKKYRKKLSKKARKKFDKKSKYNKPMPKGYSFTFRTSEKMVSDATKYGSRNQGSRVVFK